jgi:hypothetical protein
VIRNIAKQNMTQDSLQITSGKIAGDTASFLILVPAAGWFLGTAERCWHDSLFMLITQPIIRLKP